jgi:cellulose synthase/poly-beta-1,6-N-acetylglucosamine synthase-like glycosyltransferase
MDHKSTPLVSIIIPFGPGYSYDMVLNSIKKVDYPLDKIEVITVEGRQPAHQRNEAVKIAEGEYVFYFDDDVVIAPDIIKKAIQHFEDTSVAAVGGPNLTLPADSFLQQCFGHVMASFFGTAQMSSRYKCNGKVRDATEKELILCNLAGRTEVFRKNLFDERLWPNEENELFNRLRNQKYRLIYNPECIVYHSRRPTVRKFCKQNFGYGRGRVEMTIIQPWSMEPVFLVPLLFTLYLFSLPVLTWFLHKPALFIYLTPIIFYAALDAVVSALISLRIRSILAIPLLPVLFPLTHISYGSGMIYGFMKHFRGLSHRDLSVKVSKFKLPD